MRIGPIAYNAEQLIVELLLGIIPGAATGASLFLLISRIHWPTVLDPQVWVVNELLFWTFAGAALGYAFSHLFYRFWNLAPNASLRDFLVLGVFVHAVIGSAIASFILKADAEEDYVFQGAGLGILIGGLIGAVDWLLTRHVVRSWLS